MRLRKHIKATSAPDRYNMRDVSKVLLFRNDLSPFLVHLTRDTDAQHTAKSNLHTILAQRTLRCGTNPISDAKYRYPVEKLEAVKSYFCAISFTDTPLGEVHNLLEIEGRSIDLSPYGLVFLKDKLKKKGVSPVIYINNIKGDKDSTVQALSEMIDSNRTAAAKVLPYVAIFGKKLSPMGGTPRGGSVDFIWEREWRYAPKRGSFRFRETDLFIGLCPHDEIDDFEKQFKWLGFIDPRRNMKWYSEKLVAARQRSNLKYSVV